MDGLLLAKIAITVTVVISLSLIAEYASPRVSGMLAGFPHGVAIVLFFIGLEQGRDFAAHAAVYTLAGLGANAAFALAYWKGLRRTGRHHRWLVPPLSFLAFLGPAALFAQFSLNVFSGALLALSVIGLLAAATRRERNVKIVRETHVSWRETAVRAAAAAAIVVAITGAARLIGPDWAGLFSGFPIVTFPFLIIMHATHGREPAFTILKAYPVGLTSLVIYAVTVSFAFSAIGMAWGTAAGVAAAMAWIALFETARARMQAAGRAR